MTMNFVCAGLDIRKLPVADLPSADATVWEQEEGSYERAQADYGFYENSLQLLQTDEIDKVKNLAEAFRPNCNAALLALDISELALESYPHPAKPLHLPTNLKWKTLGFDICDMNGFFSFLAMDVYGSKPLSLFPEDQLMDAFTVSEVANIRVAQHRPFLVVRVRLLVV